MFWIRAPFDRADYDKALHRCRLLLACLGRSRPLAARLHTLQGTVLLMAGRAEEAERELRGVLTNAPSRGQGAVRWALGAALAALGRRPEAVHMYETALELDPRLMPVHGDLAALELEAGNTSRAQDLLKRALEAAGNERGLRRRDARDYVYTQACWARVLAARNRFAEAAATVEQASRHASKVRSRPLRAGGYWRIGQAHLALKNQGQALLAFENARQVDPEGYYGRLATEAIHRCQAATV